MTEPSCKRCGFHADQHKSASRRGAGCVSEITVLREALAASQQEVETLQQREREALDAHAASFGALAAISRLTALGGEVDEYDDVTKAVEAALAAAREDSARLDWLEAQRPNATVGDALAVWGGNTVSLFAPFGRTLNHQPALARADTFREAIDTARSTDAERTHGETR